MPDGTFRNRLSDFVKERMAIARDVATKIGNRARGDPVVFLNMEPFNFPTPAMGGTEAEKVKASKIRARRKLLGF